MAKGATLFLQLASLDALTAMMASLDGAKIGLTKAPLAYNPYTTLRADVVDTDHLPDYDGYAVQTVTAWTVAFKDGILGVMVDGGDKLFQPTGDSTSNNIYAWFIENSGATELLYYEDLPAPRTLATEADGLVVDVEFPVSALSP